MIRVHFESPVRAYVCYEPNWFERLVLRRQPYERVAECSGYARTWYWAEGQRSVPLDVEQQIEREWDRLSPIERAQLCAPPRVADDLHTN